MKKVFVVLVVLMAGIVMAKSSGQPIPGTDLVYTGDGTVSTVAVDVINDYPYGIYAEPEAGTIAVKIEGAGAKSCKIQSADGKKGSQDSIALIIEGGPKKIQIDFSQSKGNGKLPYLYVDGKAGKVLCKGLGENIGLIVIDNKGSDKGVHLQNISKTGAGFKSIITMGKLKRAQSNHGGFGGDNATEPGVIIIGEDSAKGQIKAKGAIENILICKSVDTNVFTCNALTEAYAECIATTSIVTGVELGKIKMIKTKEVGPAVIAVEVLKKTKEKKIKFTETVVGKENLVELDNSKVK